jgi:hypothetical protein
MIRNTKATFPTINPAAAIPTTLRIPSSDYRLGGRRLDSGTILSYEGA